MSRVNDLKDVIGRAPERLSLEERSELAGKYVAFEVYDPSAMPLRRIEAIGDTVGECARQLRQRGLDPLRYEFTRLGPH